MLRMGGFPCEEHTGSAVKPGAIAGEGLALEVIVFLLPGSGSKSVPALFTEPSHFAEP